METWTEARKQAKARKSALRPDVRETPPFQGKKNESRGKSKPQGLEDDSKSYYSVKYLGITNGEIGILSQRKPIPCKSFYSRPLPKAQSLLHLLPNPVDSLHQSYDSPLEELTREEAAGTQDDLEDSLRPAPERYNEFVVTKYLKARPLTPGKRGSEKGGMGYQRRRVEEGNNSALGLHYITPEFQPARRQRRGISGWKLSRPHSSVALARPAQSFFPKDASSTSFLPAASQSDHPEAYIQYLLRKTRSYIP